MHDRTSGVTPCPHIPVQVIDKCITTVVLAQLLFNDENYTFYKHSIAYIFYNTIYHCDLFKLIFAQTTSI